MSVEPEAMQGKYYDMTARDSKEETGQHFKMSANDGEESGRMKHDQHAQTTKSKM